MLDQKTSYKTASGNTWKIEYNKTNQPIKLTSPLSSHPLVTVYGYDEKDNRTLKTLSGNSTRYGFNEQGHIHLRVEPQGKLPNQPIFEMHYHRTGKLLSKMNSDGRTLTWVLNYFGIETEEKLLDGSKIIKIYDNKSQLVKERGEGGAPREYFRLIKKHTHVRLPHHFFDVATTLFLPQLYPVPLRHLEFQYESGMLMSVNDIAHGRVTNYHYDDLKHRVSRIITLTNGQVERIMTAQFDGKGNEILMYDTNATIAIIPDKTGNRIHLSAKFTCNGTSMSQESWNLPDAANRLVIDAGILSNGAIHVGSGLQLTYENNLRKTEKQNGIQTIINHDENERVTKTTALGGDPMSTTQRLYSPGENWIEEFQAGDSKQIYCVDTNALLYSQASYKMNPWTQRFAWDQGFNITAFTQNRNSQAEHYSFSQYGAQIYLTRNYLYLDSERN